MVTCVACGSSPNSSTKSKGITFHLFPKNDILKKSWLEFAEKNLDLTKRTYLCSEHFSKICFDRSNSNGILKENAIPTIKVTTRKYDRSNTGCELEFEKFVQGLSLKHAPSTSPDQATNVVLEPDDEDFDDLEAPGTPPKLTMDVDVCDSPCTVALKRKITSLYTDSILKSKKIGGLQKEVSNQQKKIDNLNSIVIELKRGNSGNMDTTDIKNNEEKLLNGLEDNADDDIDSTFASTCQMDTIDATDDNQQQQQNIELDSLISSTRETDSEFLTSLLPLFGQIPLERKLHVKISIINVLIKNES